MAGGQERALRRRIRTVQATKKITRAMELIAASQIVRSQSRIEAAAPYLEAMQRVLEEAVIDVGPTAGRLIGVPEAPKRVLVIALVADRGLCGGYNANVLRTVDRLVKGGAQGIEHTVVTSGKKAPPFLRYRGVPVARSFQGFSDRPAFGDARTLASTVSGPFLEGSLDQALVVSTRFLSAGSQVVETRQLLPLPVSPAGALLGSGDEASEAPPRRPGYTEFEPDGRDMLVDLVPAYVEAALFGALLEAAASEHTARQRAMAAATDNADELIKTLTRTMNRVRQDAITTEIMEIVGGAEALRHAAAEE